MFHIGCVFEQTIFSSAFFFLPFFFAKGKTLFKLKKKKKVLLSHHRKTAEVLSEDVKSVVAAHCKMVTQSDAPSPVLLPPVKVSLLEKQVNKTASFLLLQLLSELYSEI